MEFDESNAVVIRLSKGKLFFLSLGAFGGIALGIWMWSIADHQQRHSPLFMKGGAIACVSLGGFGALFGCVKALDFRPGLVIDNIGIIDNSSGLAIGRIRWEDITGIRVGQVSGQRFVVIDLVDPERHLQRSGLLRRALCRWSIPLTGSPLNLSPNAMAVSFDELMEHLTAGLEKHKKSGR